MPDADMLQKIAEVLDISVSQLLGKDQKLEQRNEIAEQLARINEQLAIKNRRVRRLWTIVGVVLGCWVLLWALTAVLSFTYFDVSSTVTTISAEEAVEVLQDEDGNILTITKIEE